MEEFCCEQPFEHIAHAIDDAVLDFQLALDFPSRIYLNRFRYWKSMLKAPFSSRSATTDHFLFRSHSTRTICWLVTARFVM